MIRAVLDVNVLVSATIAPRGVLLEILSAWLDGVFSPLTSEGIILELEEKLWSARIRGRYGVTREEIESIGALLRTSAEIVVPGAMLVPITGDPEDDYVLATALTGRRTTWRREIAACVRWESTAERGS